MAFWNRFARSRDEPKPVNSGRISSTGSYRTIFSPIRSRTADLLEELRGIHDEANAIEFISKKTPDASMGLWNFMRLANQGHSMKFYGINTRNKGAALTDLENEWRDFAARINSISNSGLDGLIDIFHKNSILFGLQMCEVEVNTDLTDVVEVHPIDPRTVTWELEERSGKKTWIPYQYGINGKIDLSKGNIFAVPLDPDGNDPRGTLIMAPALQAVDSQLQIFNDVHAVLHHQGYPRDDYEISRQALWDSCPPHIKSDKVKLAAYYKEYYDLIVSTLTDMKPDQDIVHYDDTKRNSSQSGNARSLDFRAINELTDIQTLNGLKQLGTFANRHSGRTETFSTVEMKIFVQGILSLQRGSKRLIEEVARIWLRVKGIQAVPIFTHNVIDWERELDKENVASLKQRRYAIAVLMGWIDNDTAAKETMNVKRAVGEPMVDAIKVNLSSGGDGSGNDKHSGSKLQPKEPSD
jgi:hypothetical protein